MQTLEFTRALAEIVKGLQVDPLVGIIQHWMAPTPTQNPPLPEPEKDAFSKMVFESYAGYDRLLKGEATGKILSLMSLQELYEHSRLRRLVVQVSGAGHLSQTRAMPDLLDFYETLKSLQRVERTTKTLLETAKVSQVDSSSAILELQLIDYEGKGIEPTRVARVSIVLNRLHTDLARLLGVQGDKLLFQYFDSGSDLILGIKAAAPLVAAIGDLFLRFWDKIMFRRQETLEKDIEVLSKGLDFLSKAKEAVDKGAITDEESRILRTKVFRDVDQLIGLGTSLPIRDTTTIDQRQLLIDRRDVKLLGAGSADGDSEPPDDSGAEPPLKPIA